MDYVVFGRGTKNLVILPGLSDGLGTVRKKGFVLAMYYKCFWKDFRVYVISRKNQIDEGYDTADMADDLAKALEELKVSKASVMGVSQGGMIAQHLAIRHPDKVEKLVLAVTTAKATDTLNKVVGDWIDMAKNDDYYSLLLDTTMKTYTQKKAKKLAFWLPIMSHFGKPKSYDRFLIQAKACMSHNAVDELDKITCPTYVLGGDSDQVVGLGTSELLAERIDGSFLKIYPGLGHGAFEEVRDFNQVISSFLL